MKNLFRSFAVLRMTSCMEIPPIVTNHKKSDDKFLRKRVPDFDFSKVSKKEIKEVISAMKLAMDLAKGIGLSANQIGLSYRFFIAKPEKKMYVVVNPEIMKPSEEIVSFEEGCLSVPGTYGPVDRPERIVVRGQDKNGKKVKFKVNGLLARVFQHEIDHLNGVLFIDKAREVYQASNKE